MTCKPVSPPFQTAYPFTVVFFTFFRKKTPFPVYCLTTLLNKGKKTVKPDWGKYSKIIRQRLTVYCKPVRLGLINFLDMESSIYGNRYC